MLCHRLDRETTGLVVCAKRRDLRTDLGEQFEGRRVAKTYLALVVGDSVEDEGVFEGAIGPDDASRVEVKMTVRADGAPARTEWRVRRRLAGRSLLELRPATGRQHQLRVHCAALGIPILGDKLYQGGDELFLRSLEGALVEQDRALLVLDHHALHAWRIELRDPRTGERAEFEARPPRDVAELLSDDLGA